MVKEIGKKLKIELLLVKSGFKINSSNEHFPNFKIHKKIISK